MISKIAAGCLAIALYMPIPTANAAFFTFAEWELLGNAGKDSYVAGAVDSMLYFSLPSDPLSAAINQRQTACLNRSRMTNTQITAGLLKMASEKPSYRSAQVQAAIVEFLSQLCPDLLGTEAFMDIIKRAVETK